MGTDEVTRDEVAGRITSFAEGSRWQATIKACERLSGERLTWQKSVVRGTRVVTFDDGKAASVLRWHGATRRWSVRIEGFEFWRHIRILNKETYTPVAGFDSFSEAVNFAVKVLRSCGARINKP